MFKNRRSVSRVHRIFVRGAVKREQPQVNFQSIRREIDEVSQFAKVVEARAQRLARKELAALRQSRQSSLKELRPKVLPTFQSANMSDPFVV